MFRSNGSKVDYCMIAIVDFYNDPHKILIASITKSGCFILPLCFSKNVTSYNFAVFS